MTDLTNILTNLIADRDGIHPAHAANRVALAIRIVEAANRTDAPLSVITGALDWSNHILSGWNSGATNYLRNEVRPSRGEFSPETLALALEIATA